MILRISFSLVKLLFQHIPPKNITHFFQIRPIDSEVKQMRERIKGYNWDILYDMNPTADDYITELTELIDKEIIGTYIQKMEIACRVGDLLSALSCLRIIEQGTNLNWEEIEEPASHHIDEVREHIDYQFRFFTSCFADHIFSVDLIEKTLVQAKVFQTEPGTYFDYSDSWKEILEIFEHQLAENL